MPTTSHLLKVANLIEPTIITMKLDKGDSSSREIWKSAINTLLTALENILLDDSGLPIKQGGADVEGYYVKGLTSFDTMMEESEISFGSLSPLKRKREDNNPRKNKSQKLLSSKLARNLSLSEDESNDEGTPLKIDALMDICGGNPTSSGSSRPFHRNIRRCSRQSFGGRYVRPNTFPNTNVNSLDMDIAPDHHTADGDNINVQEPERIQMLRRIMSDPGGSYLNWNVAMSDWIELQAQKKNVRLHEFQVQFQERSRDMESSLSILHNSTPQVYDEIRDLVDRFLLNANWLRCDYNKPFTQIFPQWHSLGKKLENFVQFVAIVEDMKAIVNHEYPFGDSGFDMKKIRETLEFRKSLYGEILQQNGLAWKALGFPVNDTWIYETKQWLFGLSFHCLSSLNSELNKYEHFDVDDTRTTKFMENIMNCIKATNIAVELIGTSSNKLILPSFILATAYTEWGLSQIDRMENKVRCVEVRMIHICDNIDKILHYLHTIQDMSEQDVNFARENECDDAPENQQILKALEHFSTALVEVGLRLCEHVTKLKVNVATGPSNFAYMYSEFVVRFINRALEYTDFEEAEVRMCPLLASLKNMENAAKFG
ncbi:1878_t:CDS:2 [Acaulospora morrowiae]|uniref:1878_t:CDS:1 n=1 Tax=Acaulospora morrowiae TaxID=94023 RepID=A0A9N9F482_9GLOM|nr:1878_t:CDS:2 [Acaulospora morrowiae]